MAKKNEIDSLELLPDSSIFDEDYMQDHNLQDLDYKSFKHRLDFEGGRSKQSFISGSQYQEQISISWQSREKIRQLMERKLAQACSESEEDEIEEIEDAGMMEVEGGGDQ